ncbi:MAG TPA: hypothetical protein DEP65_10900, partial [Ruminococcus sp.]|nr:hypothetical protein [Ruminococcus sp.]
MNNQFKSVKRFFHDKFFLRVYAYIILPILIVFIFLMFTVFSYNGRHMSLLKNSYLTKLESICYESETSLRNVSIMINMLSDNESFISAATQTVQTDIATDNNISKIFAQLKQNNNLIDSIILYNRAINTVYSNSGKFNAIGFFTNDYYYAEYKKNYWDSFKMSLPNETPLAPTIVNASGKQRIVIPIVFTNVCRDSSNSIVIVNVNLSQIISTANDKKLTNNSRFLVMNNQNHNIFNENNDFKSNLSGNFFDEIAYNSSSVFNSTVDGKKTLVMTYSPKNAVLNYSYIVLVPYSDINNRVSQITFILIISILVLSIVLLTSYFNTKSIYTPIENLVSLFGNEEAPSDKKGGTDANIFNLLHNSIQKTLDNNRALSNKMQKTLPALQERCIINFLNSNEYYTPEDSGDTFSIDFKYEYFCSIVIKLIPTEEFYNTYTNKDYNTIKSGIHDIILSVFSEKFETYVFPSEIDTLYVLLNFSEKSSGDSLDKIISEIQSIMNADKDYMTLKIGIGRIYPHLDGLKKSHQEAKNSLFTVDGLAHIKLNESSSDKFILKMSDETLLFNLLIVARTNEAKKLIEKILKDNAIRNISDGARTQLYIQIFNVVFKVMRMKSINYDPERKGDLNIITEIIRLQPTDIYETLINYIDIINSCTDSANTKIDIQAVTLYIEENLNSELCLENIADNFKTTPKYLSKFFKNKLGINFTDYLANLRINKAKVILTETEKPINEIFKELGFNNRNTFIRAFKKVTGLTPSEFRKITPSSSADKH